jgi:hypothetical protein
VIPDFSPEIWAAIGISLFVHLLIALWVVVCYLNVWWHRRRAASTVGDRDGADCYLRSSRKARGVPEYRDISAVSVTTPYRVIGGGNHRVSSEERWVA